MSKNMTNKIIKPIVIIAIVILVTSAFLMYFSLSKAAENEGWLAGYAYRKHQTIVGSAGAGYDYQLYFKVYRTNGIDSGSNVYLDGKCKPDFSDVRFTDTSQQPTVFPIWKASISSNYAEFWVKPTTLDLNDNQTIALYYGNPDAIDISNGESTFPFFDDFLGSGINTTNWSHVWTAGTSSVSNSYLTMQSNTNEQPEGYQSKTTSFGYNYAFMYKAYVSSNFGSHGSALGATPSNTTIDGDTNAFLPYASTLYQRTYNGNGEPWGAGNQNSESNNNKVESIYEIRRTSGSVAFYVNNVLMSTHTSNLPTDNFYVTVYDYDNSGSLNLDWTIVRSYVSPEPSHAEWTSEEVGTNLVVYWNTGGSGACINNQLITTNGSAITCKGEVTLAAIIKSSSYLYKNITINNASSTLASYTSNPCTCTLPTDATAIWCYFAPIGGIQPYTNARFTFTPSNPQAGNTVSFDGSLSLSNEPIYKYCWNFGDSNTVTGVSVNHTYSSAGTYQVTLTVTSDAGSDSITQNINVG